MTEPFAQARLVAPGFQIVHITVRDGYRPRTIVARAGVPLRLVFHRDEDAACSERVIFSSPRLDRHLAPHGATIVELPAQGPGEVRFTCAMGVYRGLIRLTEERTIRHPGGHGRRSQLRVGVGVAAAVIVLLAAGLLSYAVPTLGTVPLLAGFVMVLLATSLAISARFFGAFPESH